MSSSQTHIIKDTLIGLDSSAILYSIQAGKKGLEFIELILSLKSRVVVPYYACVEVKDKWERKVESEIAKTERYIDKVRELLLGINAEFRDETPDPIQIDGTLEVARELNVSLSDLHASREQFLSDQFTKLHDNVWKLLDFQGLSQHTKVEVESLNNKAKQRYQKKIPPGFKDGKEKKKWPPVPDVGPLPYYPKFGDVYIWLQFCEHVGVNDVSSIVFVTNEKKQDWWEGQWDEKHSENRPRSELIKEIHSYSPESTFELLRCEDFVQRFKEVR